MIVTPRELTIFHWSLSNSKSLQVSWTLLSILADLNNVVVWMVSTRPPISSSTSSLTKTLRIVLSAPITVGTTATHIFHSFLILCLVLSTYLSFPFLRFSLFGPRGRQSPLFSRIFFSFFFFKNYH